MYSLPFVCIAKSSSQVTINLKTNLVKYQASCALNHSSLSNNVPVNDCDMLRLI
jgi:hypothetical protein